jgi:hypothetical protein
MNSATKMNATARVVVVSSRTSARLMICMRLNQAGGGPETLPETAETGHACENPPDQQEFLIRLTR